jgi:hypothetical protein
VADEAASAVVDEAVEPGGLGAVDRPVLARPAAEVLLQPQAVEGARAEELEAVRFACSAQDLVEAAEVGASVQIS